jgi:hypothetical protein
MVWFCKKALLLLNQSEPAGVSTKIGVVVEKDEGGYYVALVPELPGCPTQAKTLDEVSKRIREQLKLIAQRF